MPRLMSVTLTEQAVKDRTKTVTRRLGWKFLKPGDPLTLCRKVMGRKPGEWLVRLAEVEVVNVRREPLNAITDDEVAREGLANPAWSADPWGPAGCFVDFFCQHMRCQPHDEVTRIEWRYLEPAVTHTTRNHTWTYHLHGRRVMAVTHNPSRRTLPLDPYGDSLTIAYRRTRHGVYLARLDGRAVCEYGHR